MKKRIQEAGLGALLLVAVAGCSVWGDPSPETLSFRMDGPAGAEVTLVVSKLFQAGTDEIGTTVVTVLSSDTSVQTLPIDMVFDIVMARRFFVMATPEQDGVEVEVRIDVDDRSIFDDEGALFIEDPWRFVYVYNQLITNNVDVVF